MADTWAVEITDKRIDGKRLAVDVEFRRNNKVMTLETFVADDPSDDAWLENAIREKFRQIKSVVRAFSRVTVGAVTPASAPVLDAAREAFRADLTQYYRLSEAARIGLIVEDDAEFVAVRTRLASSYKPEYLDLLRPRLF